jgi:hypothetical protein
MPLALCATENIPQYNATAKRQTANFWAVTAGDRRAAGLELPAGNAADAQAGRLLLESVGPLKQAVNLLMDRAYEDGKTRLAA